MEIVEYIRQTRNKSYHIYKTTDGNNLQLTCEVDASYLVHPDSKGHTGYRMGFGKATGTFYCKSTHWNPTLESVNAPLGGTKSALNVRWGKKLLFFASLKGGQNVLQWSKNVLRVKSAPKEQNFARSTFCSIGALFAPLK
jgi:hypothetical protein